MKAWIVSGLAVALGACTLVSPPPKSLDDVHAASDWTNDKGADLAQAYDRGVQRWAKGQTRESAIAGLQAAGYECAFGEANEAYPEPAAKCDRIFSTRACQSEWTVMLTSLPSKPGRIDDVDTDFRRDCVGLAGDWPDPVKSAIDDQLAPPPPVMP